VKVKNIRIDSAGNWPPTSALQPIANKLQMDTDSIDPPVRYHISIAYRDGWAPAIMTYHDSIMAVILPAIGFR